MSRKNSPPLLRSLLVAFLVLSAAGAPPAGAEPGPSALTPVSVNGYVFDPLLEGEPALSLAAAAPDAPALRLVQFSGRVRDGWLSALSALGVSPLQYYPQDTFLVWADRSALSRAADRDFVRWTGDFHPEYKISADLAERQGRIDNVAVLFYNEGDPASTVIKLVSAGAEVLRYHPAQPDRLFYEAIVRLPAQSIQAVANIPTVWFLSYSSPVPGFDDEMSDQILAGNHPGGAPVTGYAAHLAGLGYGGAGITWAVIDTGIDYDHPDLAPRIVGGYDFPGACSIAGQPGADCPNGGHGTHVAGIVGGTAALGTTDANGFLYGLGVAPEVGLFAMNSLSAPAWPPDGGWQEHSKRAVLAGAIGGNNSWTTGEGINHGYQSSERTHDLMVRDGNFDTTTVAEPFIEVFSAGNSGSGANTLTAPKEAKNLIVTASSLNYRLGSIDSISYFSSRGPAQDGRIVPTITAPGGEIASTANDTGGDCSDPIPDTNGKYAFCSGTSMASPHASGAVALIADKWADDHAGAVLSPAMAKAILVNSAVDMGTPDVPNFVEGWGRVNITKALAPDADTRYFDQETGFGGPGEQWTLQTAVADPTKPVKVTLAWSDAAGAAGASPALVNNLDLTVTVGGTAYKGNVFSAGWSTTGGAADALNNLENVYAQNPSGDLTITVEAVNVPGDGIPYNGDATDQDFALVCYNCVLGPDFTLTASPPSLAVCAPAAAAFDLAVGQVSGFVEPVTLSASGVPAGVMSSFGASPVTPPGASVFTVDNTAAVAAGAYPIDITGVSASKTHTAKVTLTVDKEPPAAPALLAPPPDAVEVPLSPTLSWAAIPGAASYTVELAGDPSFASLVHTAAVTGASYRLPIALAADAQYYWRVRGGNACGETLSPASRFHTQGIACATYTSPDVPKAIPRSGSATSNLTISGSDAIKDLNVFNITGDHAAIGDISFSLRSPANTEVTIMAQQTCSGSANFDLNLDDEAANLIPCPPTDGGAFQPSNPLSAFDNQTANGTWSFTVTDSLAGNSGTLSSWSLNVCSASCQPPPAPGVLDIAAQNASTARLAWAEAGAATYEVWYAPNQPFFDPAGMTCASPAPYACSVTSALSFDHAGLGSVADSYAYVVRAANACGSANATPSNRVAEFEFALTAGTN